MSRESALDDLRDLLRTLGFAVRKKSPTEATLRVYPRGHNTYPVLNPRFYESASEFGVPDQRPCVVFDVSSKSQTEMWSQRLSTFIGDKHCAFQVTDEDRPSGYRHHGYFVLPLSLDSSGSIEWSELRLPLERVLKFLET